MAPARTDEVDTFVLTDSVKYAPFPTPSLRNEQKAPRVNGQKLEVYSPIRNEYVSISGRWLRDNFSGPESTNSDTFQRQINVLKGSINCNIKQAVAIDSGRAFDVIFEDGYKLRVTANAVTSHDDNTVRAKRAAVVLPTMWGAEIASRPPTVSFKVVERSGVAELLQKIRLYGFCIVQDTPANADGTRVLLEKIGPIRETHWGGLYDFTADLAGKDTAYTNEFLEPHTDNTYFTEPAGLQALHLLSHTEGSGGESSLVDGLAIANKLYHEDKQAYLCLSRIPVHAHTTDDNGINIQPSHPVPVFSHHPETGHLEQIRWNNADRAGLSCNVAEMDEWYDAASKFDALISDPKNQYWFQLKPGSPLIFDNWRLLHGRSEFTGKRRMCGGYINRDDFISRFRTTHLSLEELRATTLTG